MRQTDIEPTAASDRRWENVWLNRVEYRAEEKSKEGITWSCGEGSSTPDNRGLGRFDENDNDEGGTRVSPVA
jgi:hypothetical protein